MVVPEAGRVEVLGNDLARTPAARRDRLRGDHIGILFQQFNLVPRVDVLTNVLVGRLNHRPGVMGTLTSLLKMFTAEERAMAIQALDRFDLAETALQRADTDWHLDRLYDFARSIGGQKAEVAMLLPPGTEPHSFEPKPRATAFSSARPGCLACISRNVVALIPPG